MAKDTGERPDLEVGEAGVFEGVEARPTDATIYAVRTVTANDIRQVFEYGGRIAGKDQKTEAKAVFLHLADMARRLREAAELGDTATRARLKRELLAEIDFQQAEWMLARSDLPPEIRDVLLQQEGRNHFRLQVFRKLCDARQFGLTPADHFRGHAKEEVIEEHMKGRLGHQWNLFDEICSEYDGGAVRRAVKISIEGGIEDLPANLLDKFDARAFGRAHLSNAVVSRNLGGSMDNTYAVARKSDLMSKFLGEGGDLYLKWTALGLLLGNPMLAAGLWSARGISQALGYDFGQVLEKLTKTSFRAVARGSKWFFNALPESWTQKIPLKARQWLSRPLAPSFERIERASLDPRERVNQFFRGLVPFGGFGIDSGRHGTYFAKKAKRRFDMWRARRANKPLPAGEIKKPTPVSRIKVSEVATKQHEEAENTIRSACGDIIREMVKREPSKAA